MKAIRSRDNPAVKQLIALAHSSRERKKVGLTVLDGVHLIDAHRRAIGAPKQVAVAESAMTRDDVRAILRDLDERTLISLPDAFFRDISSLDSPSVAVALVETPIARPTPSDATVMVMDDIQDPGNVGSLLRSAAAAGVTEVLTSKTTAFCWSPKVLRAAQGAHFSLNIVEGADIESFLKTYRGDSLALVAQAGGTSSLFDTPLRGPVALLLGNEGAGLSPGVLGAANRRVTLPMPGKIESLNVAAAGAIALFEIVRQRTQS
ncbi:MAG: RNA methyltransferase [Betaproteobacteria bacterium]|nr:RNA methyltransferase [Betaproteobacteria bacterium]